jgi:predicted phage-related endonuclease
MLLCVKTLKKMVKQKKIEYKQFFFNSLSDNMNKNPKEYWNILKSFKKKSNEQENIPEILKDEHFQKQGNPSHFNSNFKKEIENQFKTMEEDMMYKAESDSTITYKVIKKAIFDLKKGKSAGPDRILNEVIKYTNPVMINSYMKIFNVILKTGIYPNSWKESFTIPIYKSGDKNDPNN